MTIWEEFFVLRDGFVFIFVDVDEVEYQVFLLVRQCHHCLVTLLCVGSGYRFNMGFGIIWGIWVLLFLLCVMG